MEAAATLLEERRWRDVPLEEVMARAGLARTAFYRHFDDRGALLLALLDRVRVGVDESGSVWKSVTPDGATDSEADMRAGLAELTEAMVRHGRLMQAVADESPSDAAIAAAHEGMVAHFVDVTAARIAADVAAGRSRVARPQETADALVRMNEGVLLHAFGRRPLGDPHEVSDVLASIWIATVYGT